MINQSRTKFHNIKIEFEIFCQRWVALIVDMPPNLKAEKQSAVVI
jgi:hypothetical protein